MVLRSVENIPFFFCEQWNNNNRFYPIEIATKKILSPKILKQMQNKQLYGEINHPEKRFGTNLDYVSHIITNMYFDEDKKAIIGSYDVLDTPRGRVLNTLLEYGCNVGISARALGKGIPKSKGEVADVDSYVFKTFDVVANPGFENATVLSESEDIQTTLKSLYESFDDEEKLSVDSLYESLELSYTDNAVSLDNTSIDSSSPSSNGDTILHNYEEQLLDLEFELNYYKDLNEELQNTPNEEAINTLELTTVRNLILELDYYKDKVNTLMCESDELNSKIIEQESIINKQGEIVKILNESLSSIKSKNSRYEGDMEDLRCQYESQLDSLTQKSEDIEYLSEKYEQLYSYSESVINELNSQLDEKDSIIQDKESIIQSKESIILEKESKIEELENQLNESLKPMEASFKLVNVQSSTRKGDSTTRKLYQSLNK